MSVSVVPAMHAPRRLTDTWSVLPASLALEGLGVSPVNAYLMKGREPLLVDTGVKPLEGPFLDALFSLCDPEDLRWIWLSHGDPDHTGNVEAVLDAAPNARAVAPFLAWGKLALSGCDMSRIDILDPSRPLEIGGRRLDPVRPPYFDAPETTGFFDAAERVLFVVDAFGAILPEIAEEVTDVAPDVLRDGQLAWASIDAPWLGMVDAGLLGRTLGALGRLAPDFVLSGHLPVGRDISALTAPIVHAGRGTPAGAAVPHTVVSLADALGRTARAA